MKKWFTLAGIVLSAGMAVAQSQAAPRPRFTNAAPATAAPPARNAAPSNTTTKAQPAPATQSAQAQADLSGEFFLPAFEWELPKANEITIGKVTCSGVAVQALKARKHPLQLLNPAAPAESGSGHDNVVKSPFLGGASLLKVFSIDF